MWLPRCLRRYFSSKKMVLIVVCILLLVVLQTTDWFTTGRDSLKYQGSDSKSMMSSTYILRPGEILTKPRKSDRTLKPPTDSQGLWDKESGVNLSRIHLETLQVRRSAFTGCGNNWQEKYSSFHRTMIGSDASQGRFLIYSCKGEGYGCAGYGNRLGGIASLLLLAVLTNRVFLIDWNQPKSLELERFLLPNLIQWNYTSIRLNTLQSRTHYWGKGLPKNLQSGHYVKPSNLYQEFIQWFRRVDFDQYFNKPIERITATWNFGQEIWSNSYLSRKADRLGIMKPAKRHFIVRCSYDFLFKRSPSLETKLAQVKRAFHTNTTTPIIGLHVRIGDTVFGRRRRQNTRNFKRFFSCARLVEDCIVKSNPLIKSSDVKWFLATDDVLVKKYAISRYPGKIVTLDVMPEHIGIFQKERFPSYHGTVGVFLDHFILADCFFLILSYSTFGSSALGVEYHAEHSFTYGERCGIV